MSQMCASTSIHSVYLIANDVDAMYVTAMMMSGMAMKTELTRTHTHTHAHARTHTHAHAHTHTHTHVQQPTEAHGKLGVPTANNGHTLGSKTCRKPPKVS